MTEPNPRPRFLVPLLIIAFSLALRYVPALVAPNTMFEDRRTRLDLRFTKLFRVAARVNVQANVDVYNVMNSSGIQQVTTTFGPRWLLPQNIVEPRVVQFSARLAF